MPLYDSTDGISLLSDEKLRNPWNVQLRASLWCRMQHLILVNVAGPRRCAGVHALNRVMPGLAAIYKGHHGTGSGIYFDARYLLSQNRGDVEVTQAAGRRQLSTLLPREPMTRSRWILISMGCKAWQTGPGTGAVPQLPGWETRHGGRHRQPGTCQPRTHC